jgi:hypothetical protein
LHNDRLAANETPGNVDRQVDVFRGDEMTLLELINQNASELATAGDWDGVAAALNAPTEEIVDSTMYTDRHLIVTLGPDAFRLVAATLDGLEALDPLVKRVNRLLGSTGVDFSLPLTQGMIDTIYLATQANENEAYRWSTEVRDALKHVGRRPASIAQVQLGSAVTADQCQAAWMASYLTAVARDRHANARYGIEAGAITTLEQLNAVLSGA